MPGATIVLANAKGGCGKTTSALHLAVALADAGYATLAIDADAQHTLSRHLGVLPHGIPTLRDVLFDGMPVRAAAVPVRPNLRLVPASLKLANADVALSQLAGSDLRLRRAMADPDWEVCVIDCPPSLGKLTMNALVAGSHVLVPIDSAPYALEGLDMLMQTVDEARSYYNPDLRFLGALLTLYDHTRISRQVLEEVRARWPRETLPTVIRRSTRVKEAAAFRDTVFDGGANGVGDDYRALAGDVLARLGLVRDAVRQA
jgi:chromosome partitioning protein